MILKIYGGVDLDSNKQNTGNIPNIPQDLGEYVIIRDNKVIIKNSLPKELWQRFKWYRDKVASITESQAIR